MAAEERQSGHRPAEQMRLGNQHNTILRLLAVLACVCLVAQPLLVPIHLLVEDHTYGEVAALPAPVHHHHHDHSHGHGHSHSHAHSHAHPHTPAPPVEPDGGDPHPPHPAEDHFCCQAPSFTGPNPSEQRQLAIADELPIGTPDAMLSQPATFRDTGGPQRPPPRPPAQPRAPPAIV